MILFGKKVFADRMKDLRGDAPGFSRWALNAVTGVLQGEEEKQVRTARQWSYAATSQETPGVTRC